MAVPREAAIDDAEFAPLLARMKDAVAKVCPAWLSHQREDIVQAAMIRMMRILAKEKREGDRPFPSSYLRRVAYSVTVDEIRRLRAKREQAMPATDDGQSVDVEAPGPSPEGSAQGMMVGRAIQDCLGRLIESRRQAVTLYLQGHTVPETGRLLDFKPKRAENLVYRGLADLRACLQKKGISP